MFLVQILTLCLTDKRIDDYLSSTLGSYGCTIERLLEYAGKWRWNINRNIFCGCRRKVIRH